MFFAIIPAYNEEDRISGVIEGLGGHVDRVVVVDDASVDRTVQRVQKAGATVLRHKINRGQGAALQTGHAYAQKHGADYVIHFDGDGQFDVQDIRPALAELKERGVDVLLGSRFLDDRTNMPWFKRNILHPVGRVINRVFSGLHLSDVHNGFRILNKKALEKIVITQDRMAHATEIPALIKKHNLSYIEFPVKVTYHEYGQRTSGGVRVLRDLLVGKFIHRK